LKIQPIRTLYNFLLSFQLISLIIFLFYFIDSGFDISIPIYIRFYLPASVNPYFVGLNYVFSYDFHFNFYTILGMLLVVFLVYLISSITVVGSGLTDSGTISIKQIISMIIKFTILSMPVTYLFSLSEITIQWNWIIYLISFIIYAINFITNTGENE